MTYPNLIRAFRNWRLKPKIIFFIILVIIIPYALASVYSYYAVSRAAVNVESKALSETTSLVEQDLVNSVQLKGQVYDLTFKGVLLDLEDIQSRSAQSGFSDDYLSNFYYKHQFIKGVYFVDADRKVHTFPATYTVDPAQIPGFSEASLSIAGKWTSPYTNTQTKEQLVTYVMPVHKGKAPLGTLAVDIGTKNILKDISTIDPSQSSYVALVRNGGEIITDNDQIYDDLQINKAEHANITRSPVLKRLDQLDRMLNPQETQGSFRIQTSGGQKIVTYAHVPSYGAKLVVTSPVGEIVQLQAEKANDIQQVVRQVAVKSFVYTAVLAVFIVGIAYLISERELISPLNGLRAGIKTLQQTSFSSRMQVRSRDELGELAEAFNVMAHNLQESNMHLTEEHDRLQASIDSLKLGFLMTDSNNNLLIINDAAKQMLGRGPATSVPWDFERVAQAFGESLPFPKLARDCLRGLTLDMGAINFGENILHVFAGPVLSQSISGERTAIGAVMLIEDITEQKVMERSKDEFFSIASHELRTPLTTIRGNSSMMLQIYGDQLKDQDLKLMLEDIYKSSVQLIGIVNDFLDVSRIEQGKTSYEIAPVSLENIIEAVVYETNNAANEKGIRVDTDTYTLQSLPKVVADPDRLKQVVYNLMGNAVKFTEKGGITIRTAVKDGKVSVSIIDTGRGIPPENQKLLFHKFQQAGKSLLTRDTTRGTGLGLYISKLLMEGMGGGIELTNSEPGKGSTFTFTLLVATDESLAELRSRAAQAQIDTATGLAKKGEEAIAPATAELKPTATKIAVTDKSDAKAEDPAPAPSVTPAEAPKPETPVKKKDKKTK